MLTGKETRISSQYHQVRPGGDIAVILGICKHVFAKDDEAQTEGRRVLDTAFLEVTRTVSTLSRRKSGQPPGKKSRSTRAYPE